MIADLYVSNIDELFSEGKITTKEEFFPNQYVRLISEVSNQKALARAIDRSSLVPLYHNKHYYQGVSPRDAHQTALLDMLANPKVLIISATGAAGSGKTLLATAFALDQCINENKDIILFKPAVTVGKGRAFGTVPGTMEEKLAPYIGSYQIVLETILGREYKDFVHQLQKLNKLKFLPIETVRGCTFDNATIIVDEAQNMSWYELKTLTSRIGANSKLIMLGDLGQIDINIDSRFTGLHQLVNSSTYQNSDIAGFIQLKNVYRGPICELITQVDEEINAS